MALITTILVWGVAIEHIAICGIEMFGSPGQQARAFDMRLSFVQQKEAQIALANQGVYNGMLGILMIISNFVFSGIVLTKVWYLFLVMIVLVALYGGFTATKKIWLVQLLPALITLILLIFFH